MVESVYQEIEYLKYIEENSHLLTKLHLDDLDTINTVASEARECLIILRRIKNLSPDSSVVIENIKPIIQNLELLKSKIDQSSLELLSTEYVFDLLKIICKSSQNLINNQKFMYDVNSGFLGPRDHVTHSGFEYEKMFYINEKNFEDLILNLFLLITHFERNGEISKKRKKTTSSLIRDVQNLIEIVDYLSDRYLPFALFIRPPKAFKKCGQIADKIESHLLMIIVARKLRNYIELIDKAMNGLTEIAKKYKDKPNKNINLDALIFRKDGAEELGTILRKAESMFRLL